MQAAMIARALPRSRMSPAPEQPLRILFAGQPMLMSQTSTCISSTRAAATAIRSASAP